MRRLLLLSATIVVLCGYAFSQSTNASITGRITDPSKAVVAGATIVTINTATNLSYQATTDGTGNYTFVNLPPGTYRLEVEKQGFKTIVKNDIVLHVQDVAAINFEMSLGSASESITVEGGAPLVDTQDAAVSTVVDRNFAENLPMNGRSFQTLIQLTPGVVLTPGNLNDGGQFSVNGQRASANYWMVDGVSANIGVAPYSLPGNGLSGSLGSFSTGGGTNSLVSIDAMQEFRIQTSSYAPEFGRTPGGQISILTRSGTNSFHGTLFDYFRNDILDANDWFNGATNPPLPKAKERQNDFGGTFSGPILRDRTFFFFSYEGLRLRLPRTQQTTVPDIASRQDALPDLQPYLNAFPLPNGNNLGDGVAEFNASFSNPSSLDAYSLRIDHKINRKVMLFGRYNNSPSTLVQRGATQSHILSQLFTSTIRTQTSTIGATFLLTPSSANDLRFNYSRTTAFSDWSLDDFGGAVPVASQSFPSPYTDKNAEFSVTILSLTPSQYIVGPGGKNLQRQYNLVDNLTLQKGSHSVKIGIDYRQLLPIYSPVAYGQDVLFGGVSDAENGSVLLGLTSSSIGATFAFKNLGVFAQDTWRTSPRLTLTYGLRWDVDFAPSSTDGPSLPAVTGFKFEDLSQLALAPAGTPPFATTYGNVAPRIGIAYQLSEKQDWGTVLRGGFGAFYDLADSEFGNLIGQGYPFSGLNLFFGGNFPLDAATAAPPDISVANLASPFSALTAFDPVLKLPYTLQWNVALEQALGANQALSVSYIGSTGRRLLQTARISSPTPDISKVNLVTNSATSDYHALQVKLQRHLARGFQGLASYTWAHSIDTASAGSIGTGSNALVSSAAARTNRGPSDFDIRHAFSAGITYEIPVRKLNPIVDRILRGWSLQTVVQAYSAPPVDIFEANFSQLGLFYAQVRPDRVPGQPFYLSGSQYPGGKAFNPAAFTNPATIPSGCDPLVDFPCDPARQGNLGRNALRGFRTVQWDFAVHREIAIHEPLKLEFRAEMFNVLNHPNFASPSGGIDGSLPFGVSTQTLAHSLGSNSGFGGFDSLYQVGGPRSIQFALKLRF